MPLSARMQPLTRALFMATLPSLAKLPIFGDIAFQAEGQSAVLVKVALRGKVVALGNITFLGAVPAIIITSILLVSLPVVLALLAISLHVAASITLASLTSLQWRQYICCGGFLPIVVLTSAQ
jgi:hypothetical protein